MIKGLHTIVTASFITISLICSIQMNCDWLLPLRYVVFSCTPMLLITNKDSKKTKIKYFWIVIITVLSINRILIFCTIFTFTNSVENPNNNKYNQHKNHSESQESILETEGYEVETFLWRFSDTYLSLGPKLGDGIWWKFKIGMIKIVLTSALKL